MANFDMKDYVTVAERLAAFFEKYPDGSIQSDIIELSDSRVVMRATAYRNPDDSRPSIAHSALNIPGSTPYTRGSEIENAETSAAGRAIALYGFEVKRGVATAEEVRDKQGQAGPPPKPQQTEVLIGELTRTGTIERGDGIGSDLQAHVTPDGHLIGFRLKTARGNIAQVWAEGDISETLFAAASMDVDKLLKEKATVHGLVYDVRQEGRTTFQRMRLKRIEVLGVVIPPNPISPIRPEPETEPLDDDAKKDLEEVSNSLFGEEKFERNPA